MIFPFKIKKKIRLQEDLSDKKMIEFEDKLYSPNDIIDMALKEPEKYIRLENSKKLKKQ